MPIELLWDNKDKTVIRQVFDGRWTWEEFYQMNCNRIPEMMQSVDHTVHVFSDFSVARGVPIGGALTHARNVMRYYPENWGILVIVGANTFVNLLVETFRHTFISTLGWKTFTAPTIEAAYKLTEEFAEKSL